MTLQASARTLLAATHRPRRRPQGLHRVPAARRPGPRGGPTASRRGPPNHPLPSLALGPDAATREGCAGPPARLCPCPQPTATRPLTGAIQQGTPRLLHGRVRESMAEGLFGERLPITRRARGEGRNNVRPSGPGPALRCQPRTHVGTWGCRRPLSASRAALRPRGGQGTGPR